MLTAKDALLISHLVHPETLADGGISDVEFLWRYYIEPKILDSARCNITKIEIFKPHPNYVIDSVIEVMNKWSEALAFGPKLGFIISHNIWGGVFISWGHL